MNKVALLNAMPKEKKIEVAFITVFSVIILATFYIIISMNGVVLGNDPAVHLEKAQIFLNTGEISLANLGWTPPMYQIVLAMIISFTGAAEIGQYIFVLRVSNGGYGLAAVHVSLFGCQPIFQQKSCHGSSCFVADVFSSV